jgi:hypothetical protein
VGLANLPHLDSLLAAHRSNAEFYIQVGLCVASHDAHWSDMYA